MKEEECLFGEESHGRLCLLSKVCMCHLANHCPERRAGSSGARHFSPGPREVVLSCTRCGRGVGSGACSSSCSVPSSMAGDRALLQQCPACVRAQNRACRAGVKAAVRRITSEWGDPEQVKLNQCTVPLNSNLLCDEIPTASGQDLPVDHRAFFLQICFYFELSCFSLFPQGKGKTYF